MKKFQIWSSQENANLPYFYGGTGNMELFGVAMDSSAPIKISFSSEKESMGRGEAGLTLSPRVGSAFRSA